jgi:uncharacterized membrane protein (DUF373 family)
MTRKDEYRRVAWRDLTTVGASGCQLQRHLSPCAEPAAASDDARPARPVYAGIATFLVCTALVCLVLAGKTTWKLTTDFSEQPILDLLDILLLVFIVVELLFAVRSTVQKRELLAEPFLLVGIIASIKEIVVLSVESAKEVGNGAEFDDRITEIAALGVLILLLGLTSWLLRRKEREPGEGEGSALAPERQVD